MASNLELALERIRKKIEILQSLTHLVQAYTIVFHKHSWACYIGILLKIVNMKFRKHQSSSLLRFLAFCNVIYIYECLDHPSLPTL